MITAWLMLSKGSSIVEDSVIKVSRNLWFFMKNRGAKRHSSGGFDQMEENPRRDHGVAASSSGGGPTGRVVMRRYNVDDDDDGGGDGDLMVECTGKYCKSCTAGLIADCVAICCCPCALFNFFTLAFVKFPWMVGRKCLGRGKKKRKKKKLALQERSNRNCKKCGDDINNSNVVVVERDGNLMKKGRVELGIENLYEEEREREREREEMSGDESSRNSNFSARLEAERVWLELYQIGHLGFGRVSFTGIQ